MNSGKNLFNMSADDIKYEDIKLFCEQKIREKETVDYKQELKEEIIATIAAMANTDGGIILLGVKEDEKGRSLPGKIVGVSESRNKSIQQQINNWCVAYLSPIYFIQRLYMFL